MIGKSSIPVFPAPPAQPVDGELRVVQYGPEWLLHVGAGGAVRDGNILIGEDA